MSKIIKRSLSGKPVTVGQMPNVSAYEPPELTKKKSGVQPALNFRNRIESSINYWRDKASEHLSTVEEDRRNQLDEKFEEGYSKGRKDGIAHEHSEREQYVDSHFGTNIKNINSLLEETKHIQAEAAKNIEKKIVDLSITIAETIIKRGIEIDSSIIEDVVRESLAHVISTEKLVLKVSADDYEIINDKYDQWFGMAGNVNEFRIEVDKRLAPGDCLIETEGGIIDATIRSRLDIISDELIKINSL